jgi:hypothetical protein
VGRHGAHRLSPSPGRSARERDPISRRGPPGDTLDLAVDIESCDDEAVAYAGRASVDGQDAIELVDCLGPMLSVEEFDDPAAMAERFELIRGDGAPPGRFAGVVAPSVVRTGGERGVSATATLSVPNRRRSFATTFRAVRFSRQRFCSTRKSASRSSSRAKRRSGAPGRGLCHRA